MHKNNLNSGRPCAFKFLGPFELRPANQSTTLKLIKLHMGGLVLMGLSKQKIENFCLTLFPQCELYNHIIFVLVISS